MCEEPVPRPAGKRSGGARGPPRPQSAALRAPPAQRQHDPLVRATYANAGSSRSWAAGRRGCVRWAESDSHSSQPTAVAELVVLFEAKPALPAVGLHDFGGGLLAEHVDHHPRVKGSGGRQRELQQSERDGLPLGNQLEQRYFF